MTPNASGRPGDGSFRFAYHPGTLRFGTGAVDALDEELAALDVERAIVVCGRTVGSTPAVVDPVTAGLGDRLAGVFAETTPEKRLATAVDALAELRARDADAFVALGGGSSIDVARVASALAAVDRPPAEVGAELQETGTFALPAGDLPPVVAVPTTLAGADQTAVAGVTASPDSGLVDAPVGGGVGDPRLMPAATVYDPALVATTPAGVLAASAMNGFDKPVETLYAANATAVTDATATRALSLLADGLVRLGEEGPSPAVLEPVVEGLLLAQYGITRPGETTLSVIHAFGHALTREYPVQQGAAHAVVAPRVLQSVFDAVDGRRELLAEALDVGDVADPAAAVVERVERVRDALGLPSRLRDVDGPEPPAFPAVAEATLADSFMANAPPGYDPSTADLETVLSDCW